MTRTGHTLAALNTLTALWLAYCTARTWGAAPAWATAGMAAGSLLCGIAVTRESVLAHERRLVAALLDRDHRDEQARQRQRNGRPLDAYEEAVFGQLASLLDLTHRPERPKEH
ncbi:hypothetical protein [Streptomyces sp. NPDC001781]